MLDIEDVIATCRKSTGIDEIIDRIDDYEYRINIAGDQETRINIISTSTDIAKAFVDYIISGMSIFETIIKENKDNEIKISSLIDVVAVVSLIVSEKAGEISDIVVHMKKEGDYDNQ